jgi:hypothetical protein
LVATKTVAANRIPTKVGNMRNTVLSILLVAGLTIAATYRNALNLLQINVASVNLSLASAFTQGPNPQGSLTLTLTNPSSVPLYCSEVHLQLLYKGAYLGAVHIAQPIYLAAYSTLQVVANIFIAAQNIFTSLISYAATGGVNDLVDIIGFVRIGPAKVPLTFSYPLTKILINA